MLKLTLVTGSLLLTLVLASCDISQTQNGGGSTTTTNSTSTAGTEQSQGG